VVNENIVILLEVFLAAPTHPDNKRRFAKLLLDGQESWHAIKKLFNQFSRSGIQQNNRVVYFIVEDGYSNGFK